MEHEQREDRPSAVGQLAAFLASEDGKRMIEEHVEFNRSFRYKAGKLIRRRKPRERSLESDLIERISDTGRQLHQTAVDLSKALNAAGDTTAEIAERACAFGRNLWLFDLLPVGDPAGSERDIHLYFGLRIVLGHFWKEGKNRDLFPTHGEVCQLWRSWCRKHGNPPTAKEFALHSDLRDRFKAMGSVMRPKYRALHASTSVAEHPGAK